MTAAVSLTTRSPSRNPRTARPSFAIVPLFALANAGVRIEGELGAALGNRVTLGVVLGLVPKLAEASFVGAWGGLRPATPSGSPILGPVQGWDGLLLATGHFRNGVLLSAITGEIIGALALGESPPVDTSPFLYDKLEEALPSKR